MAQNSLAEGRHSLLMFTGILIQLWIIELFLVAPSHLHKSLNWPNKGVPYARVRHKLELCPAGQEARVLDFADCRSPKTALAPTLSCVYEDATASLLIREKG